MDRHFVLFKYTNGGYEDCHRDRWRWEGTEDTDAHLYLWTICECRDGMCSVLHQIAEDVVERKHLQSLSPLRDRLI